MKVKAGKTEYASQEARVILSVAKNLKALFIGSRPRVLRYAQNDTRAKYGYLRLGGIAELLLSLICYSS